jgi:hypothetical protein
MQARVQHVALARLADLEATIISSTARLLGPADRAAIVDLVLQEVLDRVRPAQAAAELALPPVCLQSAAGLAGGTSDRVHSTFLRGPRNGWCGASQK